MRCKTCHYSLANLTEHRCPECGNPFDPNDPELQPPARPRICHAALVFAITASGLFVLGIWFSRDSDAFNTRGDRFVYLSQLAAGIGLVLTMVLWLASYIRWRRSR